MTIMRGILPELLEAQVDKLFFQEFMEKPQRHTAFTKRVKLNKAYWEDIAIAGVGRFQLMPEGMPVAFTNVVQGTRRRETVFNFALALRISYNMRRDERWDMVKKFVADLAASAADSIDRFYHGPVNDGFTGAVYLGRFEGDGVRRRLWSNGHVPLRNTATTQSNQLVPGVALNPDGMRSALNLSASMESEEERPIMVEYDTLLIHPELRWDAEVLLDSQNVPGSADNDINTVNRNKIGVSIKYSEKITDRDSWSLWRSGGDAVLALEREGLRTQQAMDDLTQDAIEMSFYACQVAVGEWRDTVGSAPP